jgi:superfamily II DNA/RNA helicase
LTPKAQRVVHDLKQHMYETPDGKAIIVTNLVRGGVDVLSEGLRQAGIEHGVFMGKGEQSEKERQDALAAHKSGKIRALIVSPAGFVGLDSPDTTMVQVYDSHFNPEQILQAEARGIRAGGQKMRLPQDRRVIVKRYVSVFPEQGGLLGFFQKAIRYRSRPKHIDQKIWERAQERHQVNKNLVDILKNRKPQEHEL